MAAIHLHLLGASQVRVGPTSIPLRAIQRDQLLAYLAYAGDWVSREQLLYLFWPDSSPRAARNNLRQQLLRARALGYAATLEIEGQRLRWSVATDAAAFAGAVLEGRWQDALALYGGPLLEGLEG